MYLPLSIQQMIHEWKWISDGMTLTGGNWRRTRRQTCFPPVPLCPPEIKTQQVSVCLCKNSWYLQPARRCAGGQMLECGRRSREENIHTFLQTREPRVDNPCIIVRDQVNINQNRKEEAKWKEIKTHKAVEDKGKRSKIKREGSQTEGNDVYGWPNFTLAACYCVQHKCTLQRK